jgi:2-methylisocitrate lyase-like PEP mutase family enzyme
MESEHHYRNVIDPGAGASRSRVAAAAERLRGLHVPGRPLLLPNAWDVMSARLVEAAGFPAVATSSAAVAGALGHEDGEAAPAVEMLAAAARVARSVSVPVTVDAEAGYRLPPRELIARLIEAGAAGFNLEDTDHSRGGLVEVGAQAARLAELREEAARAGVPLVVNAMVDVFSRARSERRAGSEATLVEPALERGRRYLEAGADCVYPIFAASEEAIARLAGELEGRVNVLYRPGAPSLERLAELGVARISLGSGLYRATEAWLGRRLAALARGEAPY